MLYPDDLERLAALSEQVSRWVLGWVRRHWLRLPIPMSSFPVEGSTTAPMKSTRHLSPTRSSVRYGKESSVQTDRR